jgi:hypothetical protein
MWLSHTHHTPTRQSASAAVVQLLHRTGQTLALQHFGSGGKAVHIARTPSALQLKVRNTRLVPQL